MPSGSQGTSGHKCASFYVMGFVALWHSRAGPLKSKEYKQLGPRWTKRNDIVIENRRPTDTLSCCVITGLPKITEFWYYRSSIHSDIACRCFRWPFKIRKTTVPLMHVVEILANATSEKINAKSETRVEGVEYPNTFRSLESTENNAFILDPFKHFFGKYAKVIDWRQLQQLRRWMP